MRRHPLLTVVLLALALVGGVACSKQTSAVGPPVAPEIEDLAAGEEQPEDAEPEQLKEKIPKREIDRLQAEAARVYGVCDLAGELDRLAPPDRRDRKELIKHAEQTFVVFKLFDPTKKVPERVEARRGRAEGKRMILPPDPVLEDIAALRQAWYAHWVRLTVFDAWFEAKTIDEAGLRRRMATAFLEVTNDEVTRASRRLSDFDTSHCHL